MEASDPYLPHPVNLHSSTCCVAAIHKDEKKPLQHDKHWMNGSYWMVDKDRSFNNFYTQAHIRSLLAGQASLDHA